MPTKFPVCDTDPAKDGLDGLARFSMALLAHSLRISFAGMYQRVTGPTHSLDTPPPGSPATPTPSKIGSPFAPNNEARKAPGRDAGILVYD
jgi:hypothetical protein